MSQQQRHKEIDQLAELHKFEIYKHGLRARCEIKGLTEHHIRSLAQLRRDRVAERLNKHNGGGK